MKAGKNRLPSLLGSILLVTLSTIVIIFPFYWMVVTSLKQDQEIFKVPPTFIPAVFTLENFKFALTQTSVPIYFLNSVIYALCTFVIVLICASLAAYGMTRFHFRGKAPYLITVLISQLMPMTTLVVPLYIVFGKLNLLNNRPAIIIVYCAIQIPIALWLLIGYFSSIPRDIDEAATIDGCSDFMILFKIILPLAKPGLMAVGLSVIISVWQELLIAMTFTNIDGLRPLMAGVSAAITKSGIEWGQMCATGIIASVPLIIAFIFCQKYLIKGLTSGSVKG
jgi:ABC-type glycerol-3-phosphate transport system permease component